MLGQGPKPLLVALGGQAKGIAEAAAQAGWTVLPVAEASPSDATAKAVQGKAVAGAQRGTGAGEQGRRGAQGRAVDVGTQSAQLADRPVVVAGAEAGR